MQGFPVLEKACNIGMIYIIKTGIQIMQWGNKPFNFADISVEDIDQELRETGDEPLIRMKARLPEGDVEALEFIGTAYLRGSNGLHADLDKALIFLQLAAECGSTTALLNVADCYAYGIGMPADPEAARNYYRLAEQSQTPSVREAARRQLELLEHAQQ